MFFIFIFYLLTKTGRLSYPPVRKTPFLFPVVTEAQWRGQAINQLVEAIEYRAEAFMFALDNGYRLHLCLLSLPACIPSLTANINIVGQIRDLIKIRPA